MSEGKKFIEKCLTADIIDAPWPHQIINNTLSSEIFKKLQSECVANLNFNTDKLIHIHPNEFKDYKINFYDETLDICQELYKNVKELHVKYPEYREYDKIGVNAHISITPPLPYKFDIHQEGLEKTWSAVTYITPDKNVGTKMYANSSDKSFVKEAEWNPNSTFIFCGVQGKTWHSYESNQNTNRITFNLFIMKYRSKKCFYPLQ